MPKAKARRKRASRSVRPHPEQIPLETVTKNTQRLGIAIDAHAGTRSIAKQAISAEFSKIGLQMVRDWKTNLRPKFSDLDIVKLSPFAWPDTMYVPSDTASSYFRPGPRADHFFTDAWSDGKGGSTANAAAGTMVAWTQALTTDRDVSGEAGLGIRYSPKNSLSYIRFQPEVNCKVTYRGFVEFWPTVVAGTLQVQGTLLMAAWLLSPVAGQPPELVRPWKEVPVFDTGVRDAGSDLSPDIHDVNYLSRDFGLSNLDTTFLLQGARTYILGVVARVRVRHNVTANGKIIPYDSTKFKLYAGMVCQMPDMFATVQTVFIP